MTSLPHLSFIRIVRQIALDADVLKNFHAQRHREEVLAALDSYARRHGPHPVLLCVRRYIEGKIEGRIAEGRANDGRR